MRGVVFSAARTVSIDTFDDPIPGHGEVVVEIKASGMCGSDLKFYRLGAKAAFAEFGTGPTDPDDNQRIIVGHEPCGIVRAIGPGVDERSIRVGDRVMVYHYTGCGTCRECRTGWTQLCESTAGLIGASVHGGHADYLKVPARTLLPLPDELTFSAGAAICCGTGTAFGALQRLNISARDTLAVFGLGPVGLAAVQLGAAMGAQVIGVDISADRAARSKTFGAVHAINSSETDPVEAIRELTKGRGATCTLDASGASSARQSAVQSAVTWGRVGMVGFGDDTTPIAVGREIIRRQLTVVGSYTFSDVGQMDCARFIADHGIDVDQLFTDRWRIDDAARAYAEFDKQVGGKAVIEF